MKEKRIPARDKLEKAYFDLLENMHYSKITVSDIISKAEVSRTTFYRQYTDIFDMHKKVAERLGGAIMEDCIMKVLTSKTEEECFDEILHVFDSQEKYIVLLSGENGSRYFFEALFMNATKNLFSENIHLTDDQLFRIRFMTVSAIGAYVRDILDGREHNAKFITLCKKMLSFDELFGGSYAK